MSSEWTWTVKKDQDFIAVPVSLLSDYKRYIGVDGIIVWVYLSWISGQFSDFEEIDVLDWLTQELGWESKRVQAGFCLLVEQGLVEVKGSSCIVRIPQSPPLDVEGALEEEAVRSSWGLLTQDSSASAEDYVFRDPMAADLAAVYDLSEKRLGTLSPMQKAKIRYWIEAKGMAADVIAFAVDYVSKKDKLASFYTLEQQLREWYALGVRDIGGLQHVLEMKE